MFPPSPLPLLPHTPSPSSNLAAAYLEHITGNGGPNLGEEEREGGKGGRGGERMREETQLLKAFRQLRLPVSVNQGTLCQDLLPLDLPLWYISSFTLLKNKENCNKIKAQSES